MRKKIEVASNGYLKTSRLNFHTADVTTFPLQKYDGIVISDVLHYLSYNAQENLLIRVMDNGKVNFTYSDQVGGQLSSEVRNELTLLTDSLKRLVGRMGSGSLSIAVEAPAGMEYKEYSNVIKALKAVNIYKYKLITTPE